jgi:predicted RNA-binding Zn ribbon-like protein
VTVTAGRPHTFELSGGALCLDFVNTVSDRPSPERVDHLATAADLADWGAQTGVLDEAEVRAALRSPTARAPATAPPLRRAVALRESLFEVFTAVAAGKTPTRDVLARLDRQLRPLLVRSVLSYGDSGFTWKPGVSDPFERVLWSVARSAVDVLTSAQLHDVRECDAGACRWLFLDTTKNRRRRWCSMTVCGNREKARRFRERRR